MNKTIDRLTANLELLKKLELLIINNPQLRFGQILESYGFTYNQTSNCFYMESSDTLKNVKAAISKYEVKNENIKK